ncbi:jg15014 [Pararge aegeria aegeria]|uniref:Jg15014 protein n=1 Tax=Pararge aegeria aegeria TaxID=348720 RepID=A0A8S4RER1_9NEOP|nr:jg15014 [Pararge aegeria aegeria]
MIIAGRVKEMASIDGSERKLAIEALALRAFRTNVSFLEELEVKERFFLQFFGHIARNKHSMERRGRSPMRFTDTIKAATQTSIVQCSRNAEDRNKWRSIAGAGVAKENGSSSTTTTLSRVND